LPLSTLLFLLTYPLLGVKEAATQRPCGQRE
jgi:hypothetical protein